MTKFDNQRMKIQHQTIFNIRPNSPKENLECPPEWALAFHDEETLESCQFQVSQFHLTVRNVCVTFLCHFRQLIATW